MDTKRSMKVNLLFYLYYSLLDYKRHFVVTKSKKILLYQNHFASLEYIQIFELKIYRTFLAKKQNKLSCLFLVEYFI